MRDLKNKLTTGKNTKNIQGKKGKMFGYQVLGFGSGADGGWDGTAEYLIVGGGGGGAGNQSPRSASGGGGGGGGYRTSLPGFVGVVLTLAEGGTYQVTVGGGGAKNDNPSNNSNGARGGNSAITHPTITDIESTGGGGGGAVAASGLPGGSGGGGGNNPPGSSSTGAGNTPPVSATPVMPGGQGFPGHATQPNYESIGVPGGGAGGVGGPGSGTGGIGLNNSITGSPVGYAGGGGAGGAGWAGHFGSGGGGQPNTSSDRGFGAGDGGAAGNPGQTNNAIAGADNTGGGGGGGGVPLVNPIVSPAANGGSGIVIIRTPGDVNLGVSPGTNSVATLPSGEKVATFTVSGNLTT